MITAIYHNMLNFVKKFVISNKNKSLRRYSKIVEKINDLEKDISLLTDADLKEKTSYFKSKLSEGSNLETILPEAFAVVREASKRSIGLRHYDVQLIGGMVLNDGKIAEMKTGEGKLWLQLWQHI